MDEYGPVFAQVYNKHYKAFSLSIAEPIRVYFESVMKPDARRELLDLCCGTGQLACHFANRGYSVTGIDRSSSMIELARSNAAEQVQIGAVRFNIGDMADFKARASLVTCTYDSLNHIAGIEALTNCFRCARQSVGDGGVFVFDMYTQGGIRQTSAVHSVRDFGDSFVVMNIVYDSREEVHIGHVKGFFQTKGDRYLRFENRHFERAWSVSTILARLRDAGWSDSWPGAITDLSAPLTHPEDEVRVFFVARA